MLQLYLIKAKMSLRRIYQMREDQTSGCIQVTQTRQQETPKKQRYYNPLPITISTSTKLGVNHLALQPTRSKVRVCSLRLASSSCQKSPPSPRLPYVETALSRLLPFSSTEPDPDSDIVDAILSIYPFRETRRLHLKKPLEEMQE